jgi:hypothetical protein
MSRRSTRSRHALEDALTAVFGRKQRVREDMTNLSPGAFRAIVGERLANLAQQLDELKGRVNGLLFLVAGTVLTQVIIRLLG